MTDRELMQQVQQVLDAWIDFSETASQRPSGYPDEIQIEGYVQRWERLEMAFDALRERLAQPEQDETLAEIVEQFPDCEVTPINKKEFLVVPRKRQSNEEWETRRQRLEECFALRPATREEKNA